MHMMTIGRFAEATGLTVKALRHYDEIGLLAPAHVDPESGHRYYEAAQVEDAVAIRRLRALELPLEEIHSLLRADADGFRSGLAAHGYHVAADPGDVQPSARAPAEARRRAGRRADGALPRRRPEGLAPGRGRVASATTGSRCRSTTRARPFATTTAARSTSSTRPHNGSSRPCRTGPPDLAADQDRLPRRRPRTAGLARRAVRR